MSRSRCCEEIRMRLYRLTTLALLVAGLAAPALTQPAYGGGGGMPQYGGGGGGPTYGGGGNGPTYGEMPRMSPYPGMRNGDGTWVPYPPGMARKISSKK